MNLTTHKQENGTKGSSWQGQELTKQAAASNRKIITVWKAGLPNLLCDAATSENYDLREGNMKFNKQNTEWITIHILIYTTLHAWICIMCAKNQQNALDFTAVFLLPYFHCMFRPVLWTIFRVTITIKIHPCNWLHFVGYWYTLDVQVQNLKFYFYIFPYILCYKNIPIIS
jgi:hypothetical protein